MAITCHQFDVVSNKCPISVAMQKKTYIINLNRLIEQCKSKTLWLTSLNKMNAVFNDSSIKMTNDVPRWEVN